MRLLLDTHILLWSALQPARLTESVAKSIASPDNIPVFSTASIWEIAIKRGLARPDFTVDPGVLRRSLLENGFEELVVTGDHAIAVARLPQLHRDPFDRILIAQATVEGITLLTADAMVARYPGAIRLV